jgi:hypothetical protein
MNRDFFSNGLLSLGTLMLVLFVAFELVGFRADPLLPGLSRYLDESSVNSQGNGWDMAFRRDYLSGDKDQGVQK